MRVGMQYGNIINIIEASTLHVTHGNDPVLNILSLHDEEGNKFPVHCPYFGNWWKLICNYYCQLKDSRTLLGFQCSD